MNIRNKTFEGWIGKDILEHVYERLFSKIRE